MRKLLITGGISAVCGAAIPVAGCVNTIHAPIEPAETRRMYLLDLGRHTRLALGRTDGGFVEYGYGEWLWYANLEDQWWRAPAAMLWPTQGTLGRREWRGEQAEDRLLRNYAGLDVLELPAAEDEVVALLNRLDCVFAEHADRLVHNERYDLAFVPHDRDYWLFNNSNHAVKEWLEAAGYEVSGTGIFAEWRLSQHRASGRVNEPSPERRRQVPHRRSSGLIWR